MTAASTFIEHQAAVRGAVLDDHDVETTLRDLVAEMRTRYGSRTGLVDRRAMDEVVD